MKYAVVAAALAASALALPAAAQMTFRHEVSGMGSYSSLERSGTDVTVSTWMLNYGYYFSPQIVGTVGVMRTDVEIEGTESDSTDLDLGVKYYLNSNFRRGALVPFVDGAIGVADSGGDDSDMKIRIGVGASYFINDSVSVDPSFSYVRISTEPGKTSGWLFGLRLTARF